MFPVSRISILNQRGSISHTNDKKESSQQNESGGGPSNHNRAGSNGAIGGGDISLSEQYSLPLKRGYRTSMNMHSQQQQPRAQGSFSPVLKKIRRDFVAAAPDPKAKLKHRQLIQSQNEDTTNKYLQHQLKLRSKANQRPNHHSHFHSHPESTNSIGDEGKQLVDDVAKRHHFVIQNLYEKNLYEKHLNERHLYEKETCERRSHVQPPSQNQHHRAGAGAAEQQRHDDGVTLIPIQMVNMQSQSHTMLNSNREECGSYYRGGGALDSRRLVESPPIYKTGPSPQPKKPQYQHHQHQHQNHKQQQMDDGQSEKQTLRNSNIAELLFTSARVGKVIKSSLDRHSLTNKQQMFTTATTKEHSFKARQHSNSYKVQSSCQQNQHQHPQQHFQQAQLKQMKKQHEEFRTQQYPTAVPKNNDKAALFDFLQNILSSKDPKDRSPESSAAQHQHPLLTVELTKAKNAPVIRQLPTNAYRGIIQTMKRKRLRKLGFFSHKPILNRPISRPECQSDSDCSLIGGSEDIHQVKLQQKKKDDDDSRMITAGFFSSFRDGFQSIGRRDSACGKTNDFHTAQQNQNDERLIDDDYKLRALASAVNSTKDVGDGDLQMNVNDLEEQFQKECDNLLVSIPIDWQEMDDILPEDLLKADKMANIDPNLHDDRNSTETYYILPTEPMAQVINNLDCGDPSTLATPVNHHHLNRQSLQTPPVHNYLEVSTHQMLPPDGLDELQRLTPLKGTNASAQIRNSIFVKGIKSQVQQIESSQPKFRDKSNSRKIHSKKKLLPPAKALNGASLYQQSKQALLSTDSINGGHSHIFNVQVNSVSRASHRRSTICVSPRQNPQHHQFYDTTHQNSESCLPTPSASAKILSLLDHQTQHQHQQQQSQHKNKLQTPAAPLPLQNWQQQAQQQLLPPRQLPLLKD